MKTARENTATFLVAGLRSGQLLDLLVETLYEAMVRRTLKGIERTT
jgi:hypothetical protein